MAEYKSKHTGAAIDAGIDRANAALPVSGGTMTGPLILSGDPTENLGAATRQYVDGEIEKIALIPGENGTTFTPSVSDEGVLTWTNNGGLANPAQANILGPKGDDGVSPAVSVAEIDGGHRVTFTDREGEKSFDVLDGSGGGVSSWNDLTDRPFYSEFYDGYILPEVTLTLAGSNEHYCTEPLQAELALGEHYTVTYNGVQYNSLAQTFVLDGHTMAALGNVDAMNGTGDTGEPFMFLVAPPDIADEGGVFAILLSMDGAESVVVSIYGPMHVYHTIDPNYLPNVNGNIVNGLAEGSLRSAMAAPDSSDTKLGLGAVALGIDAQATGRNAFAAGKSTQATQENAFAAGFCTIASGKNSHAEGCITVASGFAAHAEGGVGENVVYESTIASGDFSHAEGYATQTTSSAAHAEGYRCKANGLYSHAEGYCTIASGYSQHVQGKCNIEDSTGKYLHIVGNGSGANYRSNAHTLDTNGVAWFKSRPQFGGNAQDDGAQTLVANGDAQIILTSPGGTRFCITVDDGGALSVAAVTA